MDITTIQPYNVTPIARYLLTLQPSVLPHTSQERWSQQLTMLADMLNYFLHTEKIPSKEHIIYSYDDNLNALLKFTRYIVDQLPQQQQQKLLQAEFNRFTL